ncbi:MAG: hypothetical protein RLZZ528_1488 [Pseudomonadota bacterium]|jgi:hypothetical protein
MKRQDAKPGRAETAAEKAERLKAALRANLQRRKAQARARAAGPDDVPGDGSADNEKD